MSVIKFPTKANPENIVESLRGYIEGLESLELENRPKTVILLEYDEDDEGNPVLVQPQYAGKELRVSTLVWMLEAHKTQLLMLNMLTREVNE